MRIVLINSGNDSGIDSNANAQSWPPLNIISLATSLLEKFGDAVEVSLLDGQIDSLECLANVVRKERPDIVGISMYSTSIRNTIHLVKEAKGVGATTILGNDHASFHHRTLLRKVAEIDYICTGDVGEDTLSVLITQLRLNGDLSIVPNVAYRRDDRIVSQKESQLTKLGQFGSGSRRSKALDRIAVPNRKLLPDRYWHAYAQAFRNQHHRTIDLESVTGVATINRARGCARSRNPCRYCGIADLEPRASSPAVFWDDVREARDDVRANCLYEAFDSATSWPSLLEGWANARPDDLADTRFKMYAQAAETSERTVELFERLGVFCVNTGFDSGDDVTLKLLKGKYDSLSTNKRAAALWTSAGIEIYTSFVLCGLGDEANTRRSLDATLKFAEWLASSTSTISIDAALLYPDVSSTVGRWIWNPDLFASEAPGLGWDFMNFETLLKVSDRWRDEVFIDPLTLCDDFAGVCGVSSELLLEYERRLQLLTKRQNMNFGRSQGGKAE